MKYAVLIGAAVALGVAILLIFQRGGIALLNRIARGLSRTLLGLLLITIGSVYLKSGTRSLCVAVVVSDEHVTGVREREALLR